MKILHHVLLLGVTAAGVVTSLPAFGQLPRAAERRADRAERVQQRQVNRADYYAPQTWQQLNPWIQKNGVTVTAPVRGAARGVAAAVGQTVDAATRQGDAQFGYRDQSQQNSWFYDYYAYTPTYYTQPSEDRYAGAIRYFDADGDGTYDSQSYYQDSDGDGRYDAYNRQDFNSPAARDLTVTTETTRAKTDIAADAGTDFERGPQDARRYKVQGEITSTKKAQVNGTNNLIVGISRESGDTLAIDLGSAESLQGRKIEVGRMIVAVGAMESIGEKELLVADSIQVDNEPKFEIDRNVGLTLTGEIVEVKNINVDSVDHYVGIVDVEGQRHLVDLGPTTTYKADLKPSMQVTVRGMPVQAQEHRVILADQLRLGTEVIKIDRTRNFPR